LITVNDTVIPSCWNAWPWWTPAAQQSLCFDTGCEH